ncbi:MAG TPA: dihydrolipoamide acetyltransferase family protein [Solirubrobacteraceae bacterium]|nr:dihydrolipoamide acetyltransferase family protein [Solirubrobacteraceae bacterium]
MSSSSTEQAQGTVAVEMPQMGVSVAEGTLTVWHKHVGDHVDRDEIICEVSTDKIDTDVPSPAAGSIVELLVEEEKTVPVGTALAVIAVEGGGGGEPAAAADAPAADAPAPAHAPASGNGTANGSHASFHSPVAQRLAAAHGIDLATVKGTGRGGRVRKQDVLAAAESGRASGSSAAPAAAEPSAPSAGVSEPLSRMRRAIAEHMTRSLHTAAHCTTIIEADFSRVERERAPIGCSPLPLVARAVVAALRAHPALNSTLEGDSLTRHEDVNLGIAVSLGERGLIVPVIHRAQELSAEGLAARIAELARRARADELTADDVRGGTFTITNPGGFGSIASTPIINQPQVGILDLEAVVKRPVAIVDDAGGDAIAVRPMAYLCLSWDHRALDGALAAQFLATLRGVLEGKEVGDDPIGRTAAP